MNKIPYQYIQNDLLTTPQKYQISSYEGPGFLTSYQFSRRKIITELKKMPDFISYSDNFFSSQDISDACVIIKKNKFSNIEGIIIGKAIYDGIIDVKKLSKII